jgi:hypothetical protein
LALARVIVMTSNSQILEAVNDSNAIVQLVINRHLNAAKKFARRKMLLSQFGDCGAPDREEKAVRLLRERGELAFLGAEVSRRLWMVDAQSSQDDAVWKLKVYGYVVDMADEPRRIRWAMHKLDSGLRTLLKLDEPDGSDVWMSVAEETDRAVRDALTGAA